MGGMIMPKRVGYKCYSATWLELLLARTLPYCLPFISRRTRVRLRLYFRNRWRMRLSKDVISVLLQYEPSGLDKPTGKIFWDGDDWEWEVINDKITRK